MLIVGAPASFLDSYLIQTEYRRECGDFLRTGQRHVAGPLHSQTQHGLATPRLNHVVPEIKVSEHAVARGMCAQRLEEYAAVFIFGSEAVNVVIGEIQSLQRPIDCKSTRKMYSATSAHPIPAQVQLCNGTICREELPQGFGPIRLTCQG